MQLETDQELISWLYYHILNESWDPFLESPGNLPGLHSDYGHDTWPTFSWNLKILKFSFQSSEEN